jgi:hypothetical protein
LKIFQIITEKIKKILTTRLNRDKIKSSSTGGEKKVSEEQEKKKSDENLIKLALITAIISLAEKIIDLIIKLLDMWGS